MLALDPGGLRAEGPWLIATTWQQLELFNLEVGCELLLEALSQGGDEGVGLSGVGRSQTVGCAVPESLRHDQRVVMIARQKREVGVSLHPGPQQALGRGPRQHIKLFYHRLTVVA